MITLEITINKRSNGSEPSIVPVMKPHMAQTEKTQPQSVMMMMSR